jgi:ribosomal protein S18 acetylase RimI-like enzyme
MHIRIAKTSEAAQLSGLAVTAKRHWGYSTETMKRWEPDLTVSAESIQGNPTFVAEANDIVLGFYMLSLDDGIWELEHLWVAPERMRAGIGRSLLMHAAAQIRASGGTVLKIDADPNAERFYTACGARCVGEVPAPIYGQEKRMRPILELDVRQIAATSKY